MDIFEQAIKKASNLTFEEISQDGYREFKWIVGSLFRTAQQEGLPSKAIIITVHIEPDIASGYNFRRGDSIQLEEFLERGYELYCYHYYFSDDLEDYDVEKAKVNFAGDVLDFWAAHDVAYEAD